jgi:hypothetical protein
VQTYHEEADAWCATIARFLKKTAKGKNLNPPIQVPPKLRGEFTTATTLAVFLQIKGTERISMCASNLTCME